MKILHINTMDNGGAATAIRRIHLGLLQKGIDSKILLLHKTKNIPETYQFKIPHNYRLLPLRIIDKIQNRLRFDAKQKREQDFNQRKQGAEVFTFPYSAFDITEHALYKEADIIQLNWVSGFLDEPSFFAKNTKPVIWRMADLYTCGSGYHYEIDFPFDNLKPELEANFKIRQQALKNNDITFIPISNWVKTKADESKLIGKYPKKMIHNGVDLSVFKSHDQKFAREVFNLNPNKKILLFGSDSFQNKRKGLALFLQAFDNIQLDNIELVTFGGLLEEVKHEINKPIVNLGLINDERLLSILYSAADYFVMPSIEEAFGQITIEAMASGTPVISFPNGGSLDIIQDRVNGVLAEDFTAESLSRAISMALSINFDKNKIIEIVKNNFNIEDKVQEYINLYKTIIDKNSKFIN